MADSQPECPKITSGRLDHRRYHPLFGYECPQADLIVVHLLLYATLIITPLGSSCYSHIYVYFHALANRHSMQLYPRRGAFLVWTGALPGRVCGHFRSELLSSQMLPLPSARRFANTGTRRRLGRSEADSRSNWGERQSRAGLCREKPSHQSLSGPNRSAISFPTFSTFASQRFGLSVVSEHPVFRIEIPH